ncbi:DUF5518 domain-containing protein [Halobaculum sp. D14]|uniref:DUF5518 domain-containing protein n=1 Tax=Halobaculum sp. D14 TaxID=3421642 RepID=UPI003EB82A94
MPSVQPFIDRLPPVWRYAAVGGVVGAALTVAQNWQWWASSDFSADMVVVGGVVAGYLAKRSAADVNADRAGFLAGLVAGVPGYVWLFPALLEAAASFAGGGVALAVTAAFFLPFSVAVLAITATAGLLGSMVGGWLAGKLGARRDVAAGN